MVQSPARPSPYRATDPALTHSFEGMLMAKTCTPEHGCVLAQVMADLSVYADGSWYVAYWDPEDVTVRSQASGTDELGANALIGMLAAIQGIALTSSRS